MVAKRNTTRARPVEPEAQPAATPASLTGAPMLALQLVPLRNLRLSSLNVRTTNMAEDIEGLAHDIAVNGLQQNLVVVPHLLADAGIYEVVEGGRRLQALQKLAEQTAWDEATHGISDESLIPVAIKAREDGRAASLSGNLQRVAMNPADEYVAYHQIVGEHSAEPDPIDYCARRFGVSRQHVEGRLRLAGLAPEILDAVRDGRVGVKAAEAYGAYSDQELQRRVFQAQERQSYGAKHEPRSIRDNMRMKTYPIGIASAVYVGIDAYIAAGGRIEAELFMGADEGERLTDPSLLDKLARQKAEAEVVDRAARDGFASGMLSKLLSAQYPESPRVPDGMEKPYWYGRPLAELTQLRRRVSVGIYHLARDGSGLEWIGFFEPKQKPLATTPAATAARDWEEEARRNAIRLRAARLAVPTWHGTAFEGRVEFDDYQDEVWEAEDGAILVHIVVRVPPDDVAAHEAEAIAALEEELAAKAAADQAEEADAGEVGQ